ncbi:tyrosine-type recombinase/integrase [Paenibacillus caseinilyticus]|uniref:tyrosine-type recombinase/integrase n=1 Tax=Paenibacillus mucilaginosus TaxID=61624 RepID=UPI0009DBB1D7|nr:tyrosine-type recombinase/integrase [Paenibacillus mucilaginosus]
MIKYVNSERRQFANTQVKFNDLPDGEPLFLSNRGTPYTYSAFYSNWTTITNHAGIKLNPHKARHWFVTSMLRGIYEQSETAAQIEDKKKQLVGAFQISHGQRSSVKSNSKTRFQGHMIILIGGILR